MSIEGAENIDVDAVVVTVLYIAVASRDHVHMMRLMPGRMPLDQTFGYKVVVLQTDADDEASEGDHIGVVVATAAGRDSLDVVGIH